MTDSTPRSRKKTEAPAEHPEGLIEHAIEAIQDRVRSLELGLLEGDHTPIGELSGLIEETIHPEGEEDAPEPKPKPTPARKPSPTRKR